MSFRLYVNFGALCYPLLPRGNILRNVKVGTCTHGRLLRAMSLLLVGAWRMMYYRRVCRFPRWVMATGPLMTLTDLNSGGEMWWLDTVIWIGLKVRCGPQLFLLIRVPPRALRRPLAP